MIHSLASDSADRPARPIRAAVARLSFAIALPLLSGLGCAETVLQRNFDLTATETERLPPLRRIEGVQLWVVEVRYGPTWVEVLLRVENSNPGEVAVLREGLLLALGELEYPVDVQQGPQEVPTKTRVGAGRNAELRLRYRLTRPMAETAVLRIRALEIRGGPAAPVELLVPPHPSGEDPG